jgi:hypothetical protein
LPIIAAFDHNSGDRNRSACRIRSQYVATGKQTQGDSVISKRIGSALLPIGLWAVSCNALAQLVTIGFGQDNIATPLSPWTAGGAGVLLALAAWALLRRQRGLGLLLLAITVFAGVVTLKSQEANAFVACTSLTQPVGTRVGCLGLIAPSPDVTADYAFFPSASFAFIDVTNGVGAPVTIASINVADGATGGGWFMASDPGMRSEWTAFAPTCTVGLTVAAGGRCSLYLLAGAGL